MKMKAVSKTALLLAAREIRRCEKKRADRERRGLRLTTIPSMDSEQGVSIRNGKHVVKSGMLYKVEWLDANNFRLV